MTKGTTVSDQTPTGQNPDVPPPPAPQYPQAPAYGAQPPAYPAYGAAPAYGAYPAPPKTNTLAIVSLIASIAGVVIVYFIGSIVGIITGHMSLSQLKTSNEGGRGLALAGVIVGYVGLALSILGVIAFIAFWGWFAVNVENFPSR